MGLPLREKKVPLAHMLHTLLAKCAVEDLVASFHSFFAGCHRISGKERINPRRRFDDVLTSNLKETLIALPYEERSAFLSDLIDKHQ